MTSVNNLSWMIGGPQGSGVDSVATTFAKTCTKLGLWIFGNREYHSNIKGRHSYFQIRVAEKEIRSHTSVVHLLATFDKESFIVHQEEVVPNGAIIYDPTLITDKEIQRKDVILVPIAYLDLIKETVKEFGLEKELTKLIIMKNIISLAASFSLLELEFSLLKETIEEMFGVKRSEYKNFSLSLVEKSYKLATNFASKFEYKLKKVNKTSSRLLLTGTTACALGKIMAGCRFQTYYPITPASDESEFLESHPEFGTVVVQTEDEIAAITMAIGATLTGTRAATSTSGPGLSLMVEGFGWAGMNEVPVVLFNYQRSGPSTGLPTRHEQGDLKFVISMCHGDFARIVISPGDLYEYFYMAIDAFNFAEKHQVPVIVLNDKGMANSTATIKMYDTTNIKIDRGALLTPEDIAKLLENKEKYKRFKYTENGISSRAFLGEENAIFWNTGDEHDEYGHITENPPTRIKMMDKRMGKLELIDKDIPLEKKFTVYGKENADLTIVSWGSTKGAILDAMEELESEDYNINFLQIKLLHPFPEEAIKFLEKSKIKIDIESNYTAQLADLIKKYGVKMDHFILKYTGRPISKDEIIDSVKRVFKEKTKRIVLSYGA